MKKLSSFFTLIAFLVVSTHQNAEARRSVDSKKNDTFMQRVLNDVAAAAERDGSTRLPKQRFVKAYDTNGDGWISREEGKAIRRSLGGKTPISETRPETKTKTTSYYDESGYAGSR